jgi:hypothetical protein
MAIQSEGGGELKAGSNWIETQGVGGFAETPSPRNGNARI